MVKSTTQRRPEDSLMDKTPLSCLISPTMLASASDENTGEKGAGRAGKISEDDSEVYIQSLPKARSIQEILKDHNKNNKIEKQQESTK